MPQHQGHLLRKGRVSIPNQIYLVTTVTQKRQPVFKNFYHARFVIDSIKYEEHANHVESFCYVVMPDHLHWLFSLTNHRPLQQVVSNIKRRSAYRINQHNKKTDNAIWQPGFHDYALRQEDEIKDVARYIVANPLRAGLVEKIGDYPHWDAIWL